MLHISRFSLLVRNRLNKIESPIFLCSCSGVFLAIKELAIQNLHVCIFTGQYPYAFKCISDFSAAKSTLSRSCKI